MSLPPSETPLGAIRFNSDSSKLEYWMGSAWMQIKTFSPNLDGGVRGVWAGGRRPAPAFYNNIEFIALAAGGTTTDFGDLSLQRGMGNAFGSKTKGFFFGGQGNSPATYNNRSDSIVFSTQGNAVDFGNTLSSMIGPSGLSNATRGLCCGGATPGSGRLNEIGYITMSSEGNFIDFGDMTGGNYGGTGLASPVRGIIAGGQQPSTSASNQKQNIKIATLGNAENFGDLSYSTYNAGGASNAVRGIVAGGYAPSSMTDNIDFITLASSGHGIKFGDLTDANATGKACSNSTHFFLGGGSGTSTSIQRVKFSTMGEATDWGALSAGTDELCGATSNGHGGLG